MDLELELRKFLWANHGHDGLYGDDGEMQCGECLKIGCGDYKRSPLDKVREAFHLAKMKEIAQAQQLKQERDELQATLDLEHSRVRIVTKEWQKAHGKPNVLPDLGMLIDWMWGEVKVKCAPHEPGENIEGKFCPLCGQQLTTTSDPSAT